MSDLGALYLTDEEIEAFEKWMNEVPKPSPHIIEAAKHHAELRA